MTENEQIRSRMRLSVRYFINLGMAALALSGGFLALSIWKSARSSSLALEALSSSITCATLSQKISSDLNTHRQQTLMAGILTPSERRMKLKSLKEILNNDLNSLFGRCSSQSDGNFLKSVRKGVETYLLSFENLHSQGLHTEVLHEAVANDYQNAQQLIHELASSNFSKAEETRRYSASQTDSNNRIAGFALSALFLVIAALLIGLRFFLYKPILRIKNLIEAFNLDETSQSIEASGSTETQAIAASINRLKERLSNQKQKQLALLASIAHDLRNPLSAIKMSVDIIGQDDGIREDNRFMVDVVGRQVDHLVRLVNDLLNSAKTEGGELDLDLEVCDLRMIITDTVALHSAVSKDHQISTNFANHPLHVLGDPRRLSQVFNNLVSNALKYSPKGGEILIVATVIGEFITIEVIDSGIGIAPDDVSNIFEPFRRTSASKLNFPGLGLGLSVSRKIIHAHSGGQIIVKSSLGKGTNFTVKLHTAKHSYKSTHSPKKLYQAQTQPPLLQGDLQ